MTNESEKKREEITEAYFEDLSTTKRKISKLVPRLMVALWKIRCCHWDGAIPPLFIVTDLDVGVNNMKRLSVAFGTQQWLPFELVSRYKIFSSAVNNISPHKFLCKLPHICLRF